LQNLSLCIAKLNPPVWLLKEFVLGLLDLILYFSVCLGLQMKDGFFWKSLDFKDETKGLPVLISSLCISLNFSFDFFVQELKKELH
jgi:hypothetical protein